MKTEFTPLYIRESFTDALKQQATRIEKDMEGKWLVTVQQAEVSRFIFQKLFQQLKNANEVCLFFSFLTGNYKDLYTKICAYQSFFFSDQARGERTGFSKAKEEFDADKPNVEKSGYAKGYKDAFDDKEKQALFFFF